MKKVNFITAIAILVLAIACTKVKDPELAPASKATNFKEIKVDDQFKWNTTNSIILNFKPTVGDARIAVLKVTSEEGAVIYQRLQKAAEASNIVLQIPAHYTKLKVSFGGNVKTFDSKNSTINMDLK
ncbi:MAG: hypothetical protein ACEQSR_10790 [Candidatus Methylacidiphilales bacterium]